MKIPDIDPRDMEKYSSAITLSDMEVFVFPELMYSLVLANIMSPILWEWNDEETFKKIAAKTLHRKLMRLRQYIMDEYEFNLDLETWGLTKQNEELKRFADFIAPEDVTYKQVSAKAGKAVYDTLEFAIKLVLEKQNRRERK